MKKCGKPRHHWGLRARKPSAQPTGWFANNSFQQVSRSAVENQRAISSARMNFSNTSFESNRPRAVKRTKSPGCSISPLFDKLCNRRASILDRFLAESRGEFPQVNALCQPQSKKKALLQSRPVRNHRAAATLPRSSIAPVNPPPRIAPPRCLAWPKLASNARPRQSQSRAAASNTSSCVVTRNPRARS